MSAINYGRRRRQLLFSAFSSHSARAYDELVLVRTGRRSLEWLSGLERDPMAWLVSAAAPSRSRSSSYSRPSESIWCVNNLTGHWCSFFPTFPSLTYVSISIWFEKSKSPSLRPSLPFISLFLLILASLFPESKCHQGEKENELRKERRSWRRVSLDGI